MDIQGYVPVKEDSSVYMSVKNDQPVYVSSKEEHSVFVPLKEEQTVYSSPGKEEDQTSVHEYAEEIPSPQDHASYQHHHHQPLPTILPTLVEEEYNTTTGSVSTPVEHSMITSSQEEEDEIEEDYDQDSQDPRNSLNPALLLNRYDKRKSSPAILGLPFGLNHEAQLSLHLSQQRNSIEAAMLLANFNKLMAFPKANENDHKGHIQQQQWQDDMSIPSQNKSSWEDISTAEIENNRRHSYDVNMSWHTMSEAFLERSDLLHNSSTTNTASSSNTTTQQHQNNQHQYRSQSEAPVFTKQDNLYSNTPTKVSWSHDDLNQPQHPHHQHPQHPYNIDYSNHPISPRQQQQQLANRYHPNMSSPLAPHGAYPPPPRYPQHPHAHPSQSGQQEHPGLILHPLARQPENGEKREIDNNNPYHQQQLQAQQHQYYSYTFPQQHPMQHRYYYPANGKLPLPAHQVDPNQSMVHHPPPILAKPKRKKQKLVGESEFDIDDLGVEPNEEDYPDMSTRDVEAARTDPEARPRKQKLRFAGDQYTPQWVRYNGQSKEGLCDTCKPGKWLQLKNSAYWYHKQFFHGISSVSGKEFVQPLETRWVDQDLVEGLCHQCHQWVAVSNVKRKNSVLWYRHAHKCHVYHKPKPNVPKKR